MCFSRLSGSTYLPLFKFSTYVSEVRYGYEGIFLGRFLGCGKYRWISQCQPLQSISTDQGPIPIPKTRYHRYSGFLVKCQYLWEILAISIPFDSRDHSLEYLRAFLVPKTNIIIISSGIAAYFAG